MKLTHLSIGRRLGLAFALLLLLIALVGGVGLYETRQVNANAMDLADNWLPSVQVLGEVKAQANAARRLALLRTTAAGDEERARMAQRREDITRRQLPQLLERYERLISSPQEHQGYETLQRQWALYLDAESAAQSLVDAGPARAGEARAQEVGEASRRFEDALGTIGQLVELNVAGAAAAAEQARAGYRDAVTFSVVLIGVAIGCGVLLALLISRSIVGPIARAVSVAETVAAGDLTSKIDVQGRDEAAALLGALRAMNDRLASMVREVRNSSDAIATGSTEIASGNSDLSQRTEEQAGNLEQTAASMEELVAIVKNNSEAAQQASQLAGATAEAATQGGQVVSAVVGTMQEIAQASHRIADIIGVIDGIAFQTNILALNAAVEAARAGEQGRGFAVVASEVRTLAQRSAEAAKDIRGLIGANVDKVGQGTRQVTSAGESMQAILAQVLRVRDLVGEISGASVEQTHGIAQVGDAVHQLDRVTQQNAALVEQSAAAAESLQHQAQVLSQLVGAFRISSRERPLPQQHALPDAAEANGPLLQPA